MAMYPVREVNLSVRSDSLRTALIGNRGEGWNALLTAVADLRTADNAENNSYYYGVFNPAESFGTFCAGGCVAGLGFVSPEMNSWSRASVGLGFSGEQLAEVFAHEIGHNHGRTHSPCGGPANPDPNFPDDNGSIGSWGINIFDGTLHKPSHARDFMSYCNPAWVSKYTYEALAKRAKLLNNVNMACTKRSPARTTAPRRTGRRNDLGLEHHPAHSSTGVARSTSPPMANPHRNRHAHSLRPHRRRLRAAANHEPKRHQSLMPYEWTSQARCASSNAKNQPGYIPRRLGIMPGRLTLLFDPSARKGCAHAPLRSSSMSWHTTCVPNDEPSKSSSSQQRGHHDLSLSFYPGAKIGVLGHNGTGKSTLLRIMAGLDRLRRAKAADGLKVGFLPQEPELTPIKTWSSTLRWRSAIPVNCSHDSKKSVSSLARTPNMDELLEEYGELQNAIDAVNAWDLDRVVERAMDALRLPPPDADVTKPSGGERRRVASASCFLASRTCSCSMSRPTRCRKVADERFLDEYQARSSPSPTIATRQRRRLDPRADSGHGYPFEGNYSGWLSTSRRGLSNKRSNRQRGTEHSSASWNGCA